MNRKLLVAASLLTLATGTAAPVWAQATNNSFESATYQQSIVVAGPVDPFCIAIQIKTGRPCKH